MNSMAQKPSAIRANAGLQFIAFVLVLIIVTIVVRYQVTKRQLPCASEAQASWRMSWADGEGISKLMWSIEPQDSEYFVQCLSEAGYDVATDSKSGVMTADNPEGVTISNSIGDNFPDSKAFYRW